jgi:CBS domain-containing protein
MALVSTEPKAKDVMTADPVCVSPSTGIRELARVFEEHEISGAPVVNQEGRVIGVVSKTDLIRRCSEGTDDIPPAYLFEVLSDQGEGEETSEVMPEPLICVEDFMTEDPLMVAPDLSAGAVARLMFDRRIHRVIVADDEQFPVGMITSLDLLGLFPSPRDAPARSSGGQTCTPRT